MTIHKATLLKSLVSTVCGVLLLAGCVLPGVDGVSIDSMSGSALEGVEIEGITIEGLRTDDLTIERMTIDRLHLDQFLPQNATATGMLPGSEMAASLADEANNSQGELSEGYPMVSPLPAPSADTNVASEAVAPPAPGQSESMATESVGRESRPTAQVSPSTSPAVAAVMRSYDGPAQLRFSDQTAAAGVGFTHDTPIVEGDGAQMISGGAAGDFNNDGWTDLYVIGGGNAADALFINQQDGTFVNMAVSAGLGELHLGSGAAVGDYNNDGWQDIFVTSFGSPDDMGPGRHRLYRNNGDDTFTDVAVQAGVNRTSREVPDGLGAAFGDYDLDGDLDLFVAGWRKPGGEPALGNRLFRNNGDETFTDVTLAAGIRDDGIRGFSPIFADMDGDLYPELLLGADFNTSRYYKNNQDGTFTDITDQALVNYTGNGMGTAIGDINNDGLPDWYVTAIFGREADGRGLGNGLFINQGEHRFRQEGIARLVADGGWGWGTELADFNNDGRLDIAEVNGWDLPAYVNERGKLWLQSPNGIFEEMAEEVNFSAEENQLGLLTLDYDNDGDQDIVTTSYNGPLHLYRNDLSGAKSNWLRVVLDSSRNPTLAPDGMGSRVTFDVGDARYTRFQTGGARYLTQSETIVHVGVGSAEIIDRITVTWPDGAITVVTDLPVNQILVIAAPNGPEN